MEHTFSDSLKQKQMAGLVPVIPDIKCRSPQAGDLLNGRDPVQVAGILAAAGAPVLSVVTESEHFGGSLDLLTEIARTTGLPILRKDFIRNSKQIIETAHAGASAVLLICSMLDKQLLKRLYREAIEAGLEPLVEAHTSEELALAASLGARLTGLNNRDILQLEKDNGTVQATAELGQFKSPDSFLISESSMTAADDIRVALAAGADAVLVGTALLESSDPVSLFRRFSNARPVLKICGLKRSEDVTRCLDLGVDILGFVTEYPKSVPWNLSRDQAAQLIQVIQSNPKSARSCLVTGGHPDAVIALAKQLKPDLIQLHYRETLAETKQIAAQLKQLGIGIIQRISNDLTDRQLQYGTSDLTAIMEALNQTDVAIILADMRSPKNASQTSLTFDATFCRSIVSLSQKPVMIAGGITPDQISSAVRTTGTAFVDIMTGVEIEPGIKDHQLLQMSIEAMNGLSSITP